MQNRKKKKPLHNSIKQDEKREAPDKLPATITRIEVQKKNNTRYSLYSDDEFLTGVSDHTLTRLNIRKGTQVTHALFEQILQSEDRWAAREYFLRLLARRDHSTLELRQKARKKGLDTEDLDDILKELEDKGYIDHRIFAARFARDKFELNSWGTFRIRRTLMQKGVSTAVIDEVLNGFDEQQRTENMIHLITKHSARYRRADPVKRKKKIFDFLLRKGYDSNNILRNMDRFLAIIEK